MIDYQILCIANSKKWKNGKKICNMHLAVLDAIVNLGGEITAIEDYHNLTFSFKLPEAKKKREKLIAHVRDEFHPNDKFNKKLDAYNINCQF